MNTNTNNKVDYKMTPPPLPIIPKKKSKRLPRFRDDNDEPQLIKTPKLTRGTKAKTEIENEVITEQISDIIAECLAEVKAENCIKTITPQFEPNIILKITEAKNEKDEIVKEKLLCELAVDIIEKHSPPISPIELKKPLTIGEELPSEVLTFEKGDTKGVRGINPPEAEVLPVKFADASCQTDDPLENICVKCCAPKLDRKEYHKQYNEKNKEKISEYKKKYRQENKDKINTDAKRAYQKEYDAKNKEKIMARRNIILKCECGEEVKASSLAKHKKTKTHLLKIELRIAKGEIIIPVEAELEADDNA